MKIPYGISDFGQIRAEGFFYADKTPFLPVLEAGENAGIMIQQRPNLLHTFPKQINAKAAQAQRLGMRSTKPINPI